MDPDLDILVPIANPELIGHAPAERRLKQAFDSENLAHAWIIAGPKGIGKATLAHRFARYVLADGLVATHNQDDVSGPGLFKAPASEGEQDMPDPDSLFMAPDHPVFQRAVAGSHADLMVIERLVDDKTGRRQGQIVVDAVRRIKGFLRYTAGEGTWRVVVIDSADEMNRNAANAVLKALEEPPPNTLMLLVCHNPGRLLPTIRSRCRTLTLRPPPLPDVVSYICRRLPDLPAQQAEQVAMVAEGSIGQALALVDAGGVEMVDDLTSLMAKIASRLPVADVHDFAARLGRAGQEQAFDTFATTIRWWLEQLVIAKAGGRSISMIDSELFARVRDAADLDRWLEVWEKVTRLLDSVSVANLDRKQVVLNTFIAVDTAIRRHA